MKNWISVLFVLMAMTVVLSGCKEEKKRGSAVAASNVKNVKLTFLNAPKSKITYGDTLKVQLDFDDESPAHEVVIKTDRGSVPFQQIDSLVYTVPTVLMGGGYHGVRAEIILADSTAIRGSSSLRVLLPEAPSEWGYRSIETFPHDRQAYTQGLIYHDGTLFESTGRYGKSDIRQVNLQTGEVIQKNNIEEDFFAEGLAVYKNMLYQLTWRENTVLVHDLETLKRENSFNFSLGNGEGWGLCFNGEHFIFSDGSADIIFVDPENWTEERRIRVFDHQGDVRSLNELEFVGGKIYANMLNDSRIAVIDPKTGAITSYWNLEGLLDSQPNVGRVDVMNGIAYRTDRSTFLVTGKLWPYLFEVAPVY